MAEIKINSIQDVKSILAGTHAEQNKLQFGYAPKEEPMVTRVVGEKWFDTDGNEWEQKEGYSVKLGKQWQQELHSYLNTFTNCRREVCTCTIPKRLDEKMKAIHGMCFDCVVEMEHKIKLEKKWGEYEKEKIRQNSLSWLKEAEKDKNLIAEELSKVEFANSFGDTEKWNTNVTKEQILQKIEEEFENFRKDFIEKLEKDIGGNIGEEVEQNENNS